MQVLGPDVCAVCLDELNARAEVILPCQHAYHADCYLALVKSRVSQSQSQGHGQRPSTRSNFHALACPMCRTTLLHVHVAPARAQGGGTQPGGADVYGVEVDDAAEEPLACNALTVVALCSSMGLLAWLALAMLNQGSYGEVR